MPGLSLDEYGRFAPTRDGNHATLPEAHLPQAERAQSEDIGSNFKGRANGEASLRWGTNELVLRPDLILHLTILGRG